MREYVWPIGTPVTLSAIRAEYRKVGSAIKIIPSNTDQIDAFRSTPGFVSSREISITPEIAEITNMVGRVEMAYMTGETRKATEGFAEDSHPVEVSDLPDALQKHIAVNAGGAEVWCRKSITYLWILAPK